MDILRRRPLFCFAACFGAGVVTAVLLNVPYLVMLLAACVLGAAAGLTVLCAGKRRRVPVIALIAFYLAALCAASAYTTARIDARPRFENAYEIRFSGTVGGNPYLDENGERLVCTLGDLVLNDEPTPYKLRLYLRGNANELDRIGCGQTVSGIGHAFCPEEARNPHAFDFGAYLWRDGLAGYLSAKLQNVSVEGNPGGIQNALFSARKAVSARIDRAFPDNADLVRALILGDKRDMASEARDEFSLAGVAHLLAVSGMHITLMAMAVSFLLKKLLGLWPSTVVTLLCVFCYCALLGFTPSVTRAAIMYAMVCAAPLAGRPGDGSTRMALAFLTILLINPLEIGDYGFVLSFLATAGLIWLGSDPLEHPLGVKRLNRAMRLVSRALAYPSQAVSRTLAAQVITYPAVAAFYGTVSLISIVSNVFLVPLCMVALALSYAALAVPAFGWIPDALLTLLRRLVHACASVKWATVQVPAPPVWVWIGFLLVGLLMSDLSALPKKIKPFLLILFPILAIVPLLMRPVYDCKITFLDVGQGDSCVIETGGYTCVVDLGDDGQEAADYINGERLQTDALFLTHAHADHAGGLGEFIEQCDVSILYVSRNWEAGIENESIRTEWEQAMRQSVAYAELSPGDRFDLNAYTSITVCESDCKTGDAVNDSSMILLLKCGESEVLLSGDANPGAGPDADILKAGHHGSKTCIDETVLSSVTPEVAVISVGAGNSYGHPDPETIALLEDAGAQIYRTDQCGAVTVLMNRDGSYKVKTFLEDFP